MNLESSDTHRARISKFDIKDEKCGRAYCSVCQVPAPVIKVRVRGLCQLSLFDRFEMILTCIDLLHWHFRVYSYIINEEGLPMFVGTHTSVLFYNQSMSSWVW